MKNLSRILAIVIVLCMVLSVSALAAGRTRPDSTRASDEKALEDAYIQYLYAQLLAEEAINEILTEEIVRNEIMPLIYAQYLERFSEEMLWSELLESGYPGDYEELIALYLLASGEPSGDPSGEPSGDPSGEPSGDPSGEASGSVEDAYIEYLHEWLIAEDAINDTMTEEIRENEFMPLIYAWDFETFPAEMLWGGMLESGIPMTFEEFVAQY